VKHLECKKIIVLMLALAHNAGFSSGHAGPPPSINWWGLGSQYSENPAMGWLLITFVIFVWILATLIKKPLGLYLETRSKDIKHAIEEGQKAKEESEQKLRLYEEKLNSLDHEIAKMKASFLEQAQAERALKEKMTKNTGDRILKDIDDTIKANLERAKNKLAEEVISGALAKAQTAILESHLPEVDNYLKSSLVEDIKSSKQKGLSHDG